MLVVGLRGGELGRPFSRPVPRRQLNAFHVKRSAVAFDAARALSGSGSTNVFALSFVGDQ